ncbi:MAG: heparinase II/III-family protein [Clostridia bacterium]|nr:heparinase II/III-family protein [Clostridia bacterium]
MLVSPFVKPYITPPSEHPRLLLRAGDVLRIKKRFETAETLKSGENVSAPCFGESGSETDIAMTAAADAARLIKELAAVVPAGKGATPEYGNYNLKEALALEARAFLSLISKGTPEYEAMAKDAIKTSLFLLEGFTVNGGNMGARWGGHLIFVASEVYDWCYDILTDDEKTRIISACESIAEKYFEMKYPPSSQHAISGHGAEAQLLRDLLAFSIAVYDERPDIYDFCAGRLLSEYVPEIRLFSQSGAHPQGPTYGNYRWTSFAWAELIFDRMKGRRPFGCLEKTAEWMTYMIRPDGELFRMGDDFNENKSEYNRKHPLTVPFFFAWALYGRTDFKNAFERGYDIRFLLPEHYGMDYYDEGSWGEGLISPVSYLLFMPEKSVSAEENKPSCRYFGFPVGMTVWKKGETAVLLKAGILWGSNHDHLDTGCFQIYDGAPLLTDSGVYDSYGSEHRRQWLTTTAAHNCLTVTDPDLPGIDDYSSKKHYTGDTRRPEGGREPATTELWFDKYKMASVVSHSESEDGCELVADMSEAYVHSCESAVRTMSFDAASGTLTVTDDIVSRNPESIKTVHLHCQSEPRIEGDRIVFENRGRTAVATVKEPAGAVIEAVGGDGKQFLAGGINYPPAPPYVAEEGWGQVTVTVPEKTKKSRIVVEIKITR